MKKNFWRGRRQFNSFSPTMICIRVFYFNWCLPQDYWSPLGSHLRNSWSDNWTAMTCEITGLWWLLKTITCVVTELWMLCKISPRDNVNIVFNDPEQFRGVLHEKNQFHIVFSTSKWQFWWHFEWNLSIIEATKRNSAAEGNTRNRAEYHCLPYICSCVHCWVTEAMNMYRQKTTWFTKFHGSQNHVGTVPDWFVNKNHWLRSKENERDID